ncbi:MAG: hypothetical protein JXN59_19420 [Anaerolineae bacterium]|nr:hypothetical protein [Anaerolineae bacterium]
MGSSIIEVGIGLVLAFVLLSILASQINNIIKNLLNVRGHYFVAEFERMVTDPKLRAQMLAHPALQSLLQGDMVKQINPDKLAEILVDSLAGSGERLELLERLSNTDLVQQLLVLVEDAGLEAQLEQVLKTARSLADARLKLQEWFNVGLSRVTELYTRRMHLFSFVVGALLALTLNVDTIYLARTLWNDPVLRVAMAETAVQAAEEIDPEAPLSQDLIDSVREAQETIDQFLMLRLPVGWYYQSLVEGPVVQVGALSPLDDTRNLWNLWFANNPDWFRLLVEKIVGLLITTIAVMQGAPFWFDLLHKATGR